MVNSWTDAIRPDSAAAQTIHSATDQFALSDLAPPLDQVYAYWQRISQDQPAPLTQEFDPLEIRRALPHILLVGVESAPLDFRFRIIGEYINDRMRASYVDKTLSSIPDKGPGSQIWGQYERCYLECRPLHVRLNYTGPFSYIHASEEIYLPLVDDGGTVSRILVCITFDSNGIAPNESLTTKS